jgi:putative transposase
MTDPRISGSWTTAKDICHEHEISDATYTSGSRSTAAWKPQAFAGCRELEDENRRLKQMYADLSLENRALKDVIQKSSEAGAKLELVAALHQSCRQPSRQR